MFTKVDENMRDQDDTVWRHGDAVVRGRLPDARGFTDNDLTLLREAHRSGVAARGWGRAQFVANEFSQYLAIWDSASFDAQHPTLSIVRFDKTGTYALMAEGKIVASGKTLAAIMPTLIGARFSNDEA